MELFFLLHHFPEPWPDDPMVELTSGRNVAMEPATIPTPTSTVVHIAKSVVRYRKSPLYGFMVPVYGRRMIVAVEPLMDS